MKNRFTKGIFYLDYLRQPYEFKTKYNEQNGTVLGGVLTVIFSSMLIAYFFASYTSVEIF